MWWSAKRIFLYFCDFFQGCDFDNILEMMRFNSDHLCRELCVLLRKKFSAGRKRAEQRKLHLPTLLKAVLRLQRINDIDFSDVPDLNDTIDCLLYQLDISWLDEDGGTTTEILQVIEIFVKSFLQDDTGEKPAPPFREEDLDFDEGVCTDLVKSKHISYPITF